ncbi:lysophospholipid acyltransferase family protein [Alteraurantiacibacter buctensis]
MPHSKPSLSSRLMWRLLGWLFRVKGWRVEGRAPDLPKFIIVGAPHTSNWDFVFFAGAVEQLGIEPSFIGKHTLFRWPLRRFMYDMGGMPVDRSKPGGYVRSVIRGFEQAGRMALVIAPEGTRGSTGKWRSGFYHIAMGAQVPIVPAWVDHQRMVGGMGDPVMPTGDYRADMLRLLAYYRRVMPRCPRWDVLEASLPPGGEGSAGG